jgi:hypothetical protein
VSVITMLAMMMAGCVADDGVEPADEAASAHAAMVAVANRLPASKAVLQRTGEATALIAGVVNAGPVTVTLPTHAGGAIRAEIGGQAREVRILGANVSTARARPFDVNTVIYSSTDRGASTAATVAVDDDETVIETYTIIHDQTAAETYRTAISLAAGETLRLVDDRNAEIVDRAGMVVSAIEAPWARDAIGRDVPYSLAVDGDQLVMSVRHQDAGFTYPIVADPKIRVHCGIISCSIYFSRSTTRSLTTPSGVIALVAGACTQLPNPGAKAACTYIGLVTGVTNIKASECAGKNQCLRLRYVVPFTIPGFYCDNSGYCSN